MKKLFYQFLIWRKKRLSDRNFLMILSVIVGFMAGITAWALKTGVYAMHNYFRGDFPYDPQNYRYIVYPFIGISLALLFKNFVLKDHIPHNISSILYAIAKRNSLMRLHKIYSSITGAIFTAGFGGSIGLESPIISSGASIGSNLAKSFRLDYKSITTLLGCGAAGAIAAIFNTPIAGIVFALEVLLLDMNRFSLIPLLIAAVSGTITTKLLFRDEIMFEFTVDQPFLVQHLLYFIILGIVAGFVSSYFSKLFVAIEGFFLSVKSRTKRLLIGAPALGVLIFIFPALYGEGFDVIKAVLEGDANLIFADSIFSGYVNQGWVIVVLFLALIMFKVVATALTIGAGGIGGVFAPSLFTGGLLGYLFAAVNNSLVSEQLSRSNFALVGMACVLGGVLQAPLTGIFLIAEITSGYELIVPLMLSTTISYVTVKAINNESILTWQLTKRGQLVTHDKDKAVLHFLEVSKLVERDFMTVHESDSLSDLIKAISKSKRNIFPIINDDGYLLGIILLDDVRDIMFNADYYGTSVLNLAQMPPAVISINDRMGKVINAFNITDAWNLPVCEKGIYKGFISKSKLFSAYRAQLMNITEE